MAKPRKPIGVWMLLDNGSGPWFFSKHPTLDEAMKDARALNAARTYNRGGEMFSPSRVWIAPPPVVGLKPANARYRRAR